MKKLLAFLLVLALAAAMAVPAFADSTPAIYKVTDNEGHYIFLMGTCHILTPECLPIAGIDELLDQCTALALETDVNSDALSEATEAMLNLSGNTLSEETRNRIADFFDSKGFGVLNTIIPLLDASTLYLLVNTYMLTGEDPTQIVSPELYLNDLAQARGMPLIGLETVTDQTQAMTDGLLIYSDEEVEILINATLDQTDLYEEYIRSLQQAWASGDEEALTDFSRTENYSGPQAEVTAEVLITDRNDVFFDGIVGLFENGGGVFVAVGLAHVFDPENGLLVQLPAAGYTVERWFPAEEEALLPAA